MALESEITIYADVEGYIVPQNSTRFIADEIEFEYQDDEDDDDDDDEDDDDDN